MVVNTLSGRWATRSTFSHGNPAAVPPEHGVGPCAVLDNEAALTSSARCTDECARPYNMPHLQSLVPCA